MKRFTILTGLFFSVFILSCKSKKIECSKYKQGRFFAVMKPGGVRFEAERTVTTQTEYNPVKDITEFFTVKWTSDCSYEITKTGKRKGNSLAVDKRNITDTAKQGELIPLNNQQPLKVEITGGTDKYYLFKCWKENSDFIYRDTMWIEHLIGGFKSLGETAP